MNRTRSIRWVMGVVLAAAASSLSWADQPRSSYNKDNELCVAQNLPLKVIDMTGTSKEKQAFPVLLKGHRLVSTISSSEFVDGDLPACGGIKAKETKLERLSLAAQKRSGGVLNASIAVR